jgi:WD40 repeat protein
MTFVWYFLHRNLETEESQSISWKEIAGYEGPPGPLGPAIVPPDPPTRASFLTTPDGVLLAVGYRIHPVLIWNALDLQLLGACKPNVTNNGIHAMVFSPNPEVPALLVSLHHGSLCVFDYLTMELRVDKPDIYATSIACSSDGRTVLIGSNQGIIEIFELDQEPETARMTLTIIYRSDHPLDEPIRGVSFSPSGRFVDVRGRQGRVWTPEAIARNRTTDRKSLKGSPGGAIALRSPPRPSHRVQRAASEPEITSPVIPIEGGNMVIAGKSNGNLVLFSTTDAEIRRLYQYPHEARIASLIVVESRNRVISADDWSRIVVADFGLPLSNLTATPELIKPSIILDQRFQNTVTRMLASPSGDSVLVSSRHIDQLWKIPSGEVFVAGTPAGTTNTSNLTDTTSHSPHGSVSPAPGTPMPESRRPGPRAAFQHPTHPEWFVVVARDIARVYSWDDFTELTSPEGIRLVRESSAETTDDPPSSPQTNVPWDKVIHFLPRRPQLRHRALPAVAILPSTALFNACKRARSFLADRCRPPRC